MKKIIYSLSVLFLISLNSYAQETQNISLDSLSAWNKIVEEYSHIAYDSLQSLQSYPCPVRFDDAQAAYVNGRLGEVRRILGNCTDWKARKGGTFLLTKSQYTNSNRLLTLSSIFLKEPELAESSMLYMLKNRYITFNC